LDPSLKLSNNHNGERSPGEPIFWEPMRRDGWSRGAWENATVFSLTLAKATHTSIVTSPQILSRGQRKEAKSVFG